MGSNINFEHVCKVRCLLLSTSYKLPQLGYYSIKYSNSNILQLSPAYSVEIEREGYTCISKSEYMKYCMIIIKGKLTYMYM